MKDLKSKTFFGRLLSGSDAVDWGLSFAFSHKLKLLSLVVIPVIIKLLGYYLVQAPGLAQGQRFLGWILICASEALLLTCIAFFCTKLIRGDEINQTRILSHSLFLMPKVLLSYLALNLVTYLAQQIPLGLFSIVFFLWAPIFPALEQCLPQAAKDDEPLRPENGEGRGATILGGGEQLSFSWLKYKSAFDLGFTRSVRFTSIHWREAVLFLSLFWFVGIVPDALFSLFGSRQESFPMTCLWVPIASSLYVFILAASVMTMLKLFSSETLKELELSKPFDRERVFANLESPSFNYSSSHIKFFILTAVSVFCTILVYQAAATSRMMPETVVAEVRMLKYDSEGFKLKLDIEDSQRKFVWLNPELFEILLRAGDSSKYLSPKSFMVYNRDSGQRIFQEPGFRSTEPLSLKLNFSTLDTKFKSGDYQLFYKHSSNTARLISEGTYPKGW